MKRYNMRKLPNRSYIRDGIFNISTVLNSVVPIAIINKLIKSGFSEKSIDFKWATTVEFNKHYVYMGSHRYHTFKYKGTTCAACGIDGNFFALEKHRTRTSQWHFNLYGYNKDGVEVMLTCDHIIPKCRGGTEDISNYQTLCNLCNRKKGSLGLLYDNVTDLTINELNAVRILGNRIGFNKLINLANMCWDENLHNSIMNKGTVKS